MTSEDEEMHEMSIEETLSSDEGEEDQRRCYPRGMNRNQSGNLRVVKNVVEWKGGEKMQTLGDGLAVDDGTLSSLAATSGEDS